VLAIMIAAARDARADPFVASSCDPGDPLCVPLEALSRGAVVRRSVRKIPARDAWQIAELKRLALAVEGFAPAGACDSIVSTGAFTGLCTGSAKGPLGRVRVRMPVAVTVTEAANGAMRLSITNPSPMEIKPLLSWSPVVDPDHAKLVMDFIPAEHGWIVYSRVSVEMRDHVSSADTIAAALEKLQAWLEQHLEKHPGA
jgi:hypothetical protein